MCPESCLLSRERDRWIYGWRNRIRANGIICGRCFDLAEADEIYALPGTLNIARMERIYKDLGRCQVCNRGKAVWSEPEDHAHICKSCYHRHAGASAAVVS